MEKSNIPSKQFIFRALILLGIVGVAIVLQTKWFSNLFSKKEGSSISKNETVQEVVDKDSNENGIPDWEERLWGLDPTVLYTDGVSNKELIEQRKRSLGGADEGPVNETDRLARELFVLTTALGQSNETDKETLNAIGAKLGESVSIEQIGNQYSQANIKYATTTRTSLRQYRSTLSQIVNKYDENIADIDVIIESLESGNFSRLKELDQTAVTYKKLAGELIAMKIPIGVAQYHLDIANGLYGMGESFTRLRQIDENAVQGIAGITIYKTYALKYQQALIELDNYLKEYGIL